MEMFPVLLLVISVAGSITFQAVGATLAPEHLASYNSTPGSSRLLQVPTSCASLTLSNHGTVNNQTISTTANLFLLGNKPSLDPNPTWNFTISYILSTSPESCALGSAFRLYPGSTVSATGCYTTTGNHETDAYFYIIKGLQNYSDHYCNWENVSLEQYSFSACGEQKDDQAEATVIIQEEDDYYFALYNSGGPNATFAQTQTELSLNRTTYNPDTSDVLSSCKAHTDESCSVDDPSGDYALITVDPPDSSQWQQYIETELLCSRVFGATPPSDSGTPPPMDDETEGASPPPWVYGVIGGGVFIAIVCVVIPVIVMVRRKRKPKNHIQETSLAARHIPVAPPPSYNEVFFGDKHGRARGYSGEIDNHFTADDTAKPLQPPLEEARDSAPEQTQRENEESDEYGSFPAYAAAAALIN